MPVPRHLILASVITTILASPGAFARDDRNMYSIQDALATTEAKDKLGSNIQFFFGNQPYSDTGKKLGEFTSNRKTNAFNKSDKEACQRAFLSAMISLRDRAVKEGGDAVVNIHSYYKSKVFESNTEFECGTGTLIGGVTLRGTVVKLAN